MTDVGEAFRAFLVRFLREAAAQKVWGTDLGVTKQIACLAILAAIGSEYFLSERIAGEDIFAVAIKSLYSEAATTFNHLLTVTAFTLVAMTLYFFTTQWSARGLASELPGNSLDQVLVTTSPSAAVVLGKVVFVFLQSLPLIFLTCPLLGLAQDWRSPSTSWLWIQAFPSMVLLSFYLSCESFHLTLSGSKGGTSVPNGAFNWVVPVFWLLLWSLPVLRATPGFTWLSLVSPGPALAAHCYSAAVQAPPFLGSWWEAAFWPFHLLLVYGAGFHLLKSMQRLRPQASTLNLMARWFLLFYGSLQLGAAWLAASFLPALHQYLTLDPESFRTLGAALLTVWVWAHLLWLGMFTSPDPHLSRHELGLWQSCRLGRPSTWLALLGLGLGLPLVWWQEFYPGLLLPLTLVNLIHLGGFLALSRALTGRGAFFAALVLLCLVPCGLGQPLCWLSPPYLWWQLLQGSCGLEAVIASGMVYALIAVAGLLRRRRRLLITVCLALSNPGWGDEVMKPSLGHYVLVDAPFLVRLPERGEPILSLEDARHPNWNSRAAVALPSGEMLFPSCQAHAGLVRDKDEQGWTRVFQQRLVECISIQHPLLLLSPGRPSDEATPDIPGLASRFNRPLLSLVPDNWVGLLSQQRVVVLAGAWIQLSQPQQQAILDWTCSGRDCYLVSTDEKSSNCWGQLWPWYEDRLAEDASLLNLRRSSGSRAAVRPYGLGRLIGVRLFQAEQTNLKAGIEFWEELRVQLSERPLPPRAGWDNDWQFLHPVGLEAVGLYLGVVLLALGLVTRPTGRGPEVGRTYLAAALVSLALAGSAWLWLERRLQDSWGLSESGLVYVASGQARRAVHLYHLTYTGPDRQTFSLRFPRDTWVTPWGAWGREQQNRHLVTYKSNYAYQDCRVQPGWSEAPIEAKKGEPVGNPGMAEFTVQAVRSCPLGVSFRRSALGRPTLVYDNQSRETLQNCRYFDFDSAYHSRPFPLPLGKGVIQLEPDAAPTQGLLGPGPGASWPVGLRPFPLVAAVGLGPDLAGGSGVYGWARAGHLSSGVSLGGPRPRRSQRSAMVVVQIRPPHVPKKTADKIDHPIENKASEGVPEGELHYDPL